MNKIKKKHDSKKNVTANNCFNLFVCV
jgi:hypothetical protein